MILWSYIKDGFGKMKSAASRGESGRLRLEALNVARSLIGLGEEGGNNRGEDVETWLASVGRPGGEAWCAAFVSHCYLTAAAHVGIKLPFKTSSSAKRLTKNIIEVGREIAIEDVSPGDIICLNRGTAAWTGHVMIVVSRVGASVDVIEGNKGPYPALVKESMYAIAVLKKTLYKCASVSKGWDDSGRAGT